MVMPKITKIEAFQVDLPLREGSNCGNGLLHCSDTDLRCSVLFFCHRPRASRFLVSSLLPCGNHRGARYVSRPPITVNTTRAFRIRSGGLVRMSSDKTTKSASLPDVSVPFSFSSKLA